MSKVFKLRSNFIVPRFKRAENTFELNPGSRYNRPTDESRDTAFRSHGQRIGTEFRSAPARTGSTPPESSAADRTRRR